MADEKKSAPKAPKEPSDDTASSVKKPKQIQQASLLDCNKQFIASERARNQRLAEIRATVEEALKS